MREYARKNPEQNRARAKQWRLDHPDKRRDAERRYRHGRLDRLDTIKSERGCAECGFNAHPAALQFHHRDPEQKLLGVATLANKAWERVEEEIAKCDVLCANCHSIHHYARD